MNFCSEESPFVCLHIQCTGAVIDAKGIMYTCRANADILYYLGAVVEQSDSVFRTFSTLTGFAGQAGSVFVYVVVFTDYRFLQTAATAANSNPSGNGKKDDTSN